MNLQKTILNWAIVFALASSTIVSADDWPRWMGPTEDGIYREQGVTQSLPSTGLPVLWRAPIGGGYSGPAVVGTRVYVSDYQRTAGEVVNSPNTRTALQGKERLVCLDRDSGKTLWKYEYECPYSISYPAGPRCTPTVDMDADGKQGRVYVLGSEGDLACLNAISGELVWKRSFKQDFQAPVPIWGFSAHPLVHEDLLVCMVGGDGQTVVAFDKLTGEVRWKGLSASGAGYCPPTIVRFADTTQLIVWHADGVVSLEPKTGKPYWTVDLKPEYEMAIARPQIEGNLMYASAIRTNSVMLELQNDRPAVKELWRGEPKQSVFAANSTPLLHRGVIFGTDCNEGCLVAADAKDGHRFWTTFKATRPDESRRVNHGTAFLTRLDGTDDFLLMSENGDLILAQLTEQGYQEKWRQHLLEPTGEAFGRGVVWSHPAYSNLTAFARNDKEVLAVRLQP